MSVQMDSEKRRKNRPLKEGLLEKRGSFITSWRRRYFSLYEQRGGLLFYFLSKFDTFQGKVLGIISLKRSTVKKCDREQFEKKNKLYCLEVFSPEQNRTWYLSASTEQERDEWVDSINLVLGTKSTTLAVPDSPKVGSLQTGTHRIKLETTDDAIENIIQDDEWVNREIVRTSSFSRGSFSRTPPPIGEAPRMGSQRELKLLKDMDPTKLFFDLQATDKKGTYLGREVSTFRQVLIRIVREDEGNKSDLQELILYWSKYNHKSIINTFGCYRKNNEIWFVEEWYRLTLADLNVKEFFGEIEELEGFIAYICREVLTGLYYLHDMGTIQGRVQAENVIIDPSGGGVVKLVKPIEADIGGLVESEYEIDPDITMPDDVAAIGNMLQDFLGPSLRWSSELTDFLDKCLILDPYERPTAKQLLEDPFIARKCSEVDDFDSILTKFAGYTSDNRNKE